MTTLANPAPYRTDRSSRRLLRQTDLIAVVLLAIAGTIADSMCLSPSSPWNAVAGWNEISLMLRLNCRSRRAVPMNVPLVPSPATKCVIVPAVCSMISGPVVS